MGFLTTAIGETEHGAERVGGPSAPGEGWFVRQSDGTWRQQRGHSQTPSFRTEAQFRRWVLRETREKRIPGRPRSTGSSTNPVVRFRVSDEQLAELTSAGSRRRPVLTASLEAKRRAVKEES